MKIKIYLFLFTAVSSFTLPSLVYSQDCVRTGLNNISVQHPCCTDLVLQIPDLRSTSSYTFVSTPYNPFPYVTATGTEDVLLYDDDTYSNVFNLPFPFCFFNNVETQAVVSSNGLVTFDPVYAGCAPTQAAYLISSPLPSAGTGGNCSAGHYPRKSIMGIFMDLDPRSAANGMPSSPASRKIEWRVEGVAPCRRFVVSFYRIGVYQNTSCGQNTPATFQIIMYESTGLIDVMIQHQSCAPFTIGSKLAILGILDENQAQWAAAPGKNATIWPTVNNQGFRFVPSGGASRFVSSELLTMALAPVSVATSSSSAAGLLDITFPNICTPPTPTQYIVRTTYAACENPASLVVGMDTITIDPQPMQANITSAATSCNGATDGTITVTPVGTGPYTYSLDGAPVVAGGSPYVFNAVGSGPHTVIATDVQGCQTNLLNIDVPAGPQLTTTVTVNSAACSGSPTGSITVTVPTTGTGPYQYSLDNVTWQSSNVFNGLAPNTYTVYYQSANGCSGSTPNIVITAPASMSASNTTTPVSCNGLSDGIINITVNGGVPPYQYSIDGGATWQSSNIFNVPANTYSNIIIRDVNNCTVTQNATVTEPAVLTASSATTNATCNGGSDGTITVTAGGGNTGYQYSLDGVNFQSSNVFNVTANSYTITIKDSKGCTTTINASVGLTNDLSFTPQTDVTICEGTSTQLNILSNAIQYSWTPATGLSSTSIPNPIANPTTSTTYTVTMTRGLCTTTDDVIVNVNPAPVPDAGPDGAICYGQTYTLQGSGGVQYVWTPSTYLSDPTIANPVSSATRTITYTLSEVTDAIGCRSLTTDQVIVDVMPPIKVTTTPFDTVAYAGDQFQLNATSIASNYTWSPSVGLSNPNIANPVVTTGSVGSEIVYQVIASTAAGCLGEGYVRIKVYTGPDIYVPTGFTPNNDGKNDKLIPFPVGVKEIKHFRVFNRGGQLIFSSTTLHEGWDGKFGGVEQPTGVYVWMVEGITKDNKLITKKGTVTLIR